MTFYMEMDKKNHGINTRFLNMIIYNLYNLIYACK